MPVFDPGTIAGVVGNLLVSIGGYATLAAILYNLGSILLRIVSWTLDQLLINFIAQFYDYFEKILNGEILAQCAIDGIRNRVYLIIGAVVVFRLGMLLINYIINPSEVMDEKLGVNALVKRIIIGMCLIMAIPQIFKLANDFQAAILKDQIIERIIMDDNQYNQVKKLEEKYGAGKIIGMTVFRGFWGMNEVSPSQYKKAFQDATENYDLAYVVESGASILSQVGDTYVFNYFPIVSTIVLGYVLYLIIKYCLDLVVRSFKLVILQVIAPITVVEYMINNDRNEVFKNWRKSVIANYAMLLLRVFTIWFVLYIAMIMQDSYKFSCAGNLLRDSDNLLRSIIIIGLLAFLMDFPKMISGIFGLDLEQDSGVKGVLGKIGGAAKAVGFGALAAGGAAAMGGFKGVQNSNNTRRQLRTLNNQLANGQISQSQYNANKAAIMQNHAQNKANIKSATGKSTMKGVTNNSRILGAAFGGANAVSDSIKDKEQKAEEQRYKQELLANAQSTNASTTVIAEQGKRTNLKLDDLIDNTDQTLTQTINIDQKLGTVSGNVDAIAKNTETTAQQTVNIDQKLGSVSGKVDTIAKNTETTAQQTVNIDQKLGSISGKVDTIADNTEVSAEQTIDINQKLGNISGDIGNISDNTELTADATLNVEKKINNQSSSDDDIETLNN